MSFFDHVRNRVCMLPAILAVVFVVTFARGQPPEKTASPDQADEDNDDGTFAISPPIICSHIAGYEDYDERPNTTLTKDEKLLLYFRPRHFKTEKVGKKYQAWFSEDLRIRRKGQKTPIYSKDKFAEYKQTDNDPPQFLFLRNTISLKPLKPGEYELDVILHDQVGKSAPAKRTFSFKIVESTYKPPEVEEPKGSEERPGF